MPKFSATPKIMVEVSALIAPGLLDQIEASAYSPPSSGKAPSAPGR